MGTRPHCRSPRPRIRCVRSMARSGPGPRCSSPPPRLIRVLGNRYWVPGAAAVLIWSAALLGSAALLRPHAARRISARAGDVPDPSLHALAFHFEHWRALIGEIPAASLVILAVTWWSSASTRDNARWVGAGALFALAVLTKLIALLWVAAFLIVAVAGGDGQPRTMAGTAGPLRNSVAQPRSCYSKDGASRPRLRRIPAQLLLVTRLLGEQTGRFAQQGALDRWRANLATFVRSV